MPSEIVLLTDEPDMRLDDLGRHARRAGADDGKGFADEPFGAEQANSTVEQDLSEPRDGQRSHHAEPRGFGAGGSRAQDGGGHPSSVARRRRGRPTAAATRVDA